MVTVAARSRYAKGKTMRKFRSFLADKVHFMPKRRQCCPCGRFFYKIYHRQRDQHMNGDKTMIQKAALFAAKAHEGMMRKGSQIPYIYHPMEVALIVAQLTNDPEVIAAAYLHDVLEDTSVTPEELGAAFGSRVLSFVQAESEDKSLSRCV